MVKSLKSRIEESVYLIPESTCWYWAKRLNNKGYAVIKIGAKGRKLAHRISYEVFIGPIAEGLQIDHLCRNRSCVNPKHLEPVTPKVNSNRGLHASSMKTHCPRGHAYTKENTYLGHGRRHCLACNRERCRRDYRRRQSAKALALR